MKNKVQLVEKELLNRVKVENVPALKATLKDLDKINSLAFYQCGILLNNDEILEIQNKCLNTLASFE